MYGSIIKVNKSKPKINAGVIVLLLFIVFFCARLIHVLKESRENGALAYVQLLNFGMPIVEGQIYNKDQYVENNLSIKAILLKTLGLNNLNGNSIIGNEVSYFKNTNSSDNLVSKSNINSFNISEETIIRIDNVENASLKKILDTTKPEVLIYHTHTSEAYAEFTTGDRSDSDDENYNIVGVGNELAKELQETYGIATIHDKTNHSISYNESYSRSTETLQNYLNQYGDFKIIIDLHRDSGGNKNNLTAIVNGESVAKIQFVLSKSSSRYEANLALANEMMNKGNELFPGFVREHYIYNRGIMRMQQSLSDNALLIECGSNINTAQEARNSAKLIARLIAEHINASGE